MRFTKKKIIVKNVKILMTLKKLSVRHVEPGERLKDRMTSKFRKLNF